MPAYRVIFALNSTKDFVSDNLRKNLHMLREISRFRNYSGGANRRSFSDSDMDLYVWFSNGAPERFHLTYNKPGTCHAVSWNYETGFRPKRNAQIETLATMLGFPHLLNDFYLQDTTCIHISQLASSFLHSSDNIAPWLADFIYARLLEYPARNAIRINQGTVLRSF